MDSDTLWQHVDAERSWLADLLESLPASAWVHPSLCPEWTVRDVAAHLVFAHARVRDLLWPRSGQASATTRSSVTPRCAAP